MFKKLVDNFFKSPFEKEAQKIISEGIKEENEKARKWWIKQFNIHIQDISNDESLSQKQKEKTLQELKKDLKNIKSVEFLPMKFIKIWHNSIKAVRRKELLFNFPKMMDQLLDRLSKIHVPHDPDFNKIKMMVEATIKGAKMSFFEDLKEQSHKPGNTYDYLDNYQKVYSDVEKLVSDMEKGKYG